MRIKPRAMIWTALALVAAGLIGFVFIDHQLNEAISALVGAVLQQFLGR